MEHQLKLAQIAPEESTAVDIAEAIYVDIEGDLKEVNTQINTYHDKIVKNKI